MNNFPKIYEGARLNEYPKRSQPQRLQGPTCLKKLKLDPCPCCSDPRNLTCVYCNKPISTFGGEGLKIKIKDTIAEVLDRHKGTRIALWQDLTSTLYNMLTGEVNQSHRTKAVLSTSGMAKTRGNDNESAN